MVPECELLANATNNTLMQQTSPGTTLVRHASLLLFMSALPMLISVMVLAGTGAGV